MAFCGAWALFSQGKWGLSRREKEAKRIMGEIMACFHAHYLTFVTAKSTLREIYKGIILSTATGKHYNQVTTTGRARRQCEKSIFVCAQLDTVSLSNNMREKVD